MDPTTVTVGVKAAKELQNFLLPGSESQKIKFGYGGTVEKEKECKVLNIFAEIMHRTGSDFTRMQIDPEATPLDVREKISAESEEALDQDTILDENGFRLSKDLETKSLYNFSNNCHLALRLAYKKNFVGGIVDNSKRWWRREGAFRSASPSAPGE
eukprot:g122.t1